MLDTSPGSTSENEVWPSSLARKRESAPVVQSVPPSAVTDPFLVSWKVRASAKCTVAGKASPAAKSKRKSSGRQYVGNREYPARRQDGIKEYLEEDATDCHHA